PGHLQRPRPSEQLAGRAAENLRSAAKIQISCDRVTANVETGHVAYDVDIARDKQGAGAGNPHEGCASGRIEGEEILVVVKGDRAEREVQCAKIIQTIAN